MNSRTNQTVALGVAFEVVRPTVRDDRKLAGIGVIIIHGQVDDVGYMNDTQRRRHTCLVIRQLPALQHKPAIICRRSDEQLDPELVSKPSLFPVLA